MSYQIMHLSGEGEVISGFHTAESALRYILPLLCGECQRLIQDRYEAPLQTPCGREWLLIPEEDVLG